MTLRSFTASRTLDLGVEPWAWPFAKERRAEIDAHFAVKQREKPKIWNGRVLLGRNPVFHRRAVSRQLFRDRFRKLPGLARLGFSGQGRVQRLRHGRAALLRRRVRAGRNGPSIPRMPGGSIFRRARPISTISGRRGRYRGQRRARGRGGNRPDACRLSGRRALGLRRIGASIAMIRILDVEMTGEALRARIEANLARQATAGTSRDPSGARRRAISPPAMPRFVTAYHRAQIRWLSPPS